MPAADCAAVVRAVERDANLVTSQIITAECRNPEWGSLYATSSDPMNPRFYNGEMDCDEHTCRGDGGM